MANLNLDQDVANKRERKLTTVHIVANFFPYQVVRMRGFGSLININPSREKLREIFLLRISQVKVLWHSKFIVIREVEE